MTQTQLPPTESHPQHPEYVTRMFVSSDNLIMTWPQFAIYSYFFVDRGLAVQNLLDVWLGLPEEEMEPGRIANITSYVIPDIDEFPLRRWMRCTGLCLSLRSFTISRPGSLRLSGISMTATRLRTMNNLLSPNGRKISGAIG